MLEFSSRFERVSITSFEVPFRDISKLVGVTLNSRSVRSCTKLDMGLLNPLLSKTRMATVISASAGNPSNSRLMVPSPLFVVRVKLAVLAESQFNCSAQPSTNLAA